jgi:hypothetical protein
MYDLAKPGEMYKSVLQVQFVVFPLGYSYLQHLPTCNVGTTYEYSNVIPVLLLYPVCGKHASCGMSAIFYTDSHIRQRKRNVHFRERKAVCFAK